MSEIDDYREAVQGHKDLLNFMERTEHVKVKHDYNRDCVFPKFYRKTENGGFDTNTRLPIFLADACAEKAVELYGRALELSVADVAKKHSEAQEEAIRFIKSTP